MSQLEQYGGPWQPPAGPQVTYGPPAMSSAITTTSLYPVPYPAPYPPAYAPRLATVMTDQRPVSGGVVVVAWLVAILTLGFMLPWAIAVSRGRSNHGAIGLLNFFLGWSGIGWIVAMVMACESHAAVGYSNQSITVIAPTLMTSSMHVQHPALPAGWYPVPNGIDRQYWGGTAWTGHRAP